MITNPTLKNKKRILPSRLITKYLSDFDVSVSISNRVLDLKPSERLKMYAEFMGVSRSWVYKQIRWGRLKHYDMTLALQKAIPEQSMGGIIYSKILSMREEVERSKELECQCEIRTCRKIVSKSQLEHNSKFAGYKHKMICNECAEKIDNKCQR